MLISVWTKALKIFFQDYRMLVESIKRVSK